jgi:penicillin-binding protein 1A
LPDVESLKTVQLQIPLRIYTEDGLLIAEYGQKRRIPVQYKDIPQPLIDGILATEDQRFFEHPGVDMFGLGRAALQLLKTGQKAQGGSTITMQVARNFFLSRKKTYLRKFNEILLAIKIDRELPKEKILELYLNKIYLGNRAYGVATAARVYYGKKLKNLTLAQMAMIAGLPQAPSSQNPIANPKAALKRRNHVLSRMLEEEKISKEAFLEAIKQPITAKYHQKKVEVYAPYVAEMIRQSLYEHFGKDAYNRGYKVYSTVNSQLQKAANTAVEDSLLSYEKRHGYKGPVAKFKLQGNESNNGFDSLLANFPIISDLIPVLITDVNLENLQVYSKTKELLSIPAQSFKWAFPAREQTVKLNSKFSKGEVIYLRKDRDWELAQIPDVEGALVSITPTNGAIKALVGGFNFQKSKYNRVTQAKRQPGSSFKPFIYAAALNKGLNLATIINDAPIVVDDPSLVEAWRPHNHNREFYGPTRLREGLIRSRNLVSIRVLELTGIDYSINFLKNFGFDANDLPRSLSLALGSLTLTPLQITKAYSVIANGGFAIDPYLINTIKNSRNQLILTAKPKTVCNDCVLPKEEQAKRVIDPEVAYLMDSALRDVIQNGTGRGAKVLARNDLAGKTGTTNSQLDAWFTGYAGGLATSVWVGYDKPRTLNEYAAKVALPIWVSYMKAALKDKAIQLLKQPNNMVTLRINNQSGLRTTRLENSRFEVFRKENVPDWEPSEAQTNGKLVEDQSPQKTIEDLF